MDFVQGKVLEWLTFLSYFVFRYKIMKNENYKNPYDISESVIDQLLFNLQIYVLIPFFPYMTVLAPLFLIVQFKFEFHKLKHLRSKPEKLSLRNDTGFFIMTMFNISIVIILGFLVVFYISEIPHSTFMEVNKII